MVENQISISRILTSSTFAVAATGTSSFTISLRPCQHHHEQGRNARVIFSLPDQRLQPPLPEHRERLLHPVHRLNETSAARTPGSSLGQLQQPPSGPSARPAPRTPAAPGTPPPRTRCSRLSSRGALPASTWTSRAGRCYVAGGGRRLNAFRLRGLSRPIRSLLPEESSPLHVCVRLLPP